MSEKIVRLNEEVIKGQIKELVRGSVEENLNGLLEEESEKLTQAAKYERNEARRGYRSGHYSRRIRTNNAIERLNREIRRRTRVVGTFPDGNSALMPVCARLHHVAGTQFQKSARFTDSRAQRRKRFAHTL